MNCNIVCLVLGLIAIANLALSHCHAQDQRRASGGERGVAPNSTPGVVRLAFLGDLMLGGDVSQKLRNGPPERLWGDALPILRQMDAVIANLESPITTSDERSRRDWKFFHFKAYPDAVRILTAGNVRIVNLANNHILDYGGRGLLDTVQALDRAGIGHAGAGLNRAEAAAGQIFDILGLKVGLISATNRMRNFAATPDKEGTNFLEVQPHSPGLVWIQRSASDLRRLGATLIVLSMHWGPTCGPRQARISVASRTPPSSAVWT
jgi:poly-gamma-glutamate synthesis protein (capsule biosynthesis protein)